MDHHILSVVRRRASTAFFVVDADGTVLLADRASRTLLDAVEPVVREMARAPESDASERVAITDTQGRYVVRFVDLGGPMGAHHGVFIESLRQRAS